MTKQGYIAFDLGAESGRAMLAVLDHGRLSLEETHRFANQPQHLPSGYHWNLMDLWQNLQQGLARCAAKARDERLELVGVGVDTWGVDFGLLGKSGQLLGLPYAYRDPRNANAMRQALRKLGAPSLYAGTGIQLMPFNSLFQLYAQKLAEPGLLDQARQLLFMPDLLHYFLCGQGANEASIASTSQMIDPTKGKGLGAWNKPLLKKLGLPTHFLRSIVPAGTKIGRLLPEVAKAAGLPQLAVITPASHDTGSAVAAVPVEPTLKKSGRWAYLSSGTWSLLGAELDAPLINEETRKHGFTHERGVDGTIRFLKNIAGLWLVQEVRRDYEKRGERYDYSTLTRLAGDAGPFVTLVDPAYAPFASPGDMCAKIDAFAAKTSQPRPQSVGAYVRCCLESLALTYRRTLLDLEALRGVPVEVLHVVGGGGRNELLSQMTADAIDRPVIVGPFEATAAGNALTQAMGHRALKNLAELRACVRRSFDPIRYEPRRSDAFAAQTKRFDSLLA